MRSIADLHIHSPFSRATSKESNLHGLAGWARLKGITILATGDFTHPAWFRYLKEELVAAEPGLYRLAREVPPTTIPTHPATAALSVRFLLTTEISCIYKRHGRVRKVHNILFVPDFASVERLNARLAAIGNIESDGRPILGLDSRNLLEIMLETAPEGFLVPAHIWTPWFSLFGSKSGFDSVEECFGDLTPHIFALETGLSSDPAMNRLVSMLDRYTFISNSDCHSPAKLGREANLFDTELSYFALRDALKEPQQGFLGTIEFFPEEGKYHLDGHRDCQVRLDPHDTRRQGGLCPKCGRPLTIGVAHRVGELADRDKPLYPAGCPGYRSIIPLPEVLGEILRQGPATKRVLSEFHRVLARFGPEFTLLLDTPLEEIRRYSTILGEAIQRIRTGQVIKEAGYDGEFGVIRVFHPGEQSELAGQDRLFGKGSIPKKTSAPAPASAPPLPARRPAPAASDAAPPKINAEQALALSTTGKRILVAAGPGTGKTFTLVARIEQLLNEQPECASSVVAITFTNRAAKEIRERLERAVGAKAAPLFVGTFHRFCLDWLRRGRPSLVIIDRDRQDLLLRRLFPAHGVQARKELASAIAMHYALSAGHRPVAPTPSLASATLPPSGRSHLEEASREAEITLYLAHLTTTNAIDLDGIIPSFLELLLTDEELAAEMIKSVSHLFVDEFQDVNASQYALVTLLGEQANIFAIGDPNQAIYGFRGSDVQLFFRFAGEKGQGGSPTTQIELVRNYRSSATIVAAAQAVIGHNKVKADSPLLAIRAGGMPIHYYQASSPLGEAEYIVEKIEEIMGGISHFSIDSGRGAGGGSARSFGDIAILYRLGMQAAILAEALTRRGIPFQQVGGTPFFMKTQLRPLALYLRAAATEARTTEFAGLLRHLPGIGRKTLDLIETIALEQDDFGRFMDRLALPKRAMEKIRQVAEELTCFRKQARQTGIATALAPLLSMFAIPAQQEDGERFLNLAAAFGHDLDGFSHHLREQAEATIYDERAEAVALMTIHGAKGLEFPTVFVTGLEDGILPATRTKEELAASEEERRLFYVAMTRARDQLFLTAAARREIYGNTRQQSPSPFLDEIPSPLMQEEKGVSKRKGKGATQLRLF